MLYFKIYEHKFYLEPYNTAQEKAILESTAFGNENPDVVLRIIGVPEETINSISETVKKLLICKYREISVGESDFRIKFNCNSCGWHDDPLIEGVEITEPEETDPNILTLEKPLTEENIQDFIRPESEIIVEDLPILEYERFFEKVKRCQYKVSFSREYSCPQCNASTIYSFAAWPFLIKSLSDENLATLFTTYNSMIQFGNYSKLDIDSMLPFERSILISLLNKTIEEKNKQNRG